MTRKVGRHRTNIACDFQSEIGENGLVQEKKHLFVAGYDTKTVSIADGKGILGYHLETPFEKFRRTPEPR
jgi:hypothetical protein